MRKVAAVLLICAIATIPTGCDARREGQQLASASPVSSPAPTFSGQQKSDTPASASEAIDLTKPVIPKSKLTDAIEQDIQAAMAEGRTSASSEDAQAPSRDSEAGEKAGAGDSDLPSDTNTDLILESSPSSQGSSTDNSLTLESTLQPLPDAAPARTELSLASAPIQQVPDDASDKLIASNDRSTVPKPSLLDQANAEAKPSSSVLATDAEKNQKIAEGWTKPWAVLFITGQQMGYIEPCGCTGLENQKGGLNRRDTLMAELRARDFSVVPIDVGNQERRTGRQGHLKFVKTVEAMKQMGYKSVALGPEDLKFSPVDLVYSMTDVDGDDTPFVSANVRLFDSYPDEFKVVEVGSRRIGITGFLGKTQEKIENSDMKISEPIASVQSVLEKLKAAKCDYFVLLAHASIEESAAVAKAVPGFDLVVTAGGVGEPTYKPEPIEGSKSVMVQVGVKGMYTGILGLFEDGPPRYQRIALSAQFPDSPRMMELFSKYQDSLQTIGFEGLGARPSTHPSTREYVGTEKCGECHTKAYEIWKNTPHSHATDSIVSPPSRGEVARHFDPECVSCHVTGWNPQEYFPYASGYSSLDATPHLVGSGCENCHGPGSAHVAAEEGDMPSDETLLAKLRDEMRLPLKVAEDKCLECHDMDNSPAFHDEGAFQKYWERVKHYGKD